MRRCRSHALLPALQHELGSPCSLGSDCAAITAAKEAHTDAAARWDTFVLSTQPWQLLQLKLPSFQQQSLAIYPTNLVQKNPIFFRQHPSEKLHATKSASLRFKEVFCSVFTVCFSHCFSKVSAHSVLKTVIHTNANPKCSRKAFHKTVYSAYTQQTMQNKDSIQISHVIKDNLAINPYGFRSKGFSRTDKLQRSL